MTEKRFPRPKFYYGLDGNIRDEKHIFETRTMPKEDIDELFYDEKHLGSNSLMDLLNEQSETITRLEKENQALRDANDGLTGTIAHFIEDGDME